MSLQAFYNVEHPSGGPEWSLRFNLQLLFPPITRHPGQTSATTPEQETEMTTRRQLIQSVPAVGAAFATARQCVLDQGTVHTRSATR